MYTIEYIVHTYVHKCEYICAYVYPAKENEYTCNNVHMYIYVCTCTNMYFICVYTIVQFNLTMSSKYSIMPTN